MEREFLQALRIGDTALPEEVIEAILEQSARELQDLRQAVSDWEDRYGEAVKQHEKQLSELAFQTVLTDAVRAHGGRNQKAIAALLDLQAIRESQDPRAAAMEALEELKKDSAYLFEGGQMPPPYAPGTGARAAAARQPETLAGALRERFAGRQD